MYHATLTETFTATHALDTIRTKPHEHAWIVRITLASETLDDSGIIVNYFELKPLVRKHLPEGQYLNDLYPFAPTAENLARHFYETLKPALPTLTQVSVGEFEAFMC